MLANERRTSINFYWSAGVSPSKAAIADNLSKGIARRQAHVSNYLDKTTAHNKLTEVNFPLLVINQHNLHEEK